LPNIENGKEFLSAIFRADKSAITVAAFIRACSHLLKYQPIFSASADKNLCRAEKSIRYCCQETSKQHLAGDLLLTMMASSSLRACCSSCLMMLCSSACAFSRFCSSANCSASSSRRSSTSLRHNNTANS